MSLTVDQIPEAPERYRNHYRLFYPDHADAVFAWIHGFPHKHMTGGDHVQPLYALAFRTGPIDKQALLTCIILANHNQEPWLHERMTFHALADIQERYLDGGALYDFATTVRPAMEH